MERSRIARLCRQWSEFFPGSPALVALAPGRVNLIGEHVDYNDGHVLPMAIDRHVAVAAAPRSDRRVRIVALALEHSWNVPLDAAPPPGAPRTSLPETIVHALQAAGVPLAGTNLLVDGDLPIGAGLASSAALELGLARTLVQVAGAPWDALAMASLCQRAEQQALAVQCGPMDQVAVACGRAGAALLLDCRTLREGRGPVAIESIPLPPQAAIVIMDTALRRRLAASEYNARRRSCEAAVAALAGREPGLRSLRDADADRLAAVRERLDAATFRHALHVLEELPRPQQMAAALAAGDLPAAGALMNASHRSLADLYAVSSPELDLITELARSHPGCHGARLTGAGFGGCAVALVDRAQAEHFAQDVGDRYRARSGRPGVLFAVQATEGVALLPPH